MGCIDVLGRRALPFRAPFAILIQGIPRRSAFARFVRYDKVDVAKLKRVCAVFLCAMLLAGMAAAGASDTACSAEEAGYFDDAVFVGDSLTNQLRKFRAACRDQGTDILGTARFLSAGAYSLYMASFPKPMEDGIPLLYRGRNVSVSEGLAAMQARKAFIWLGMTTDPGKNPDRDMRWYARMVGHIREAAPGIEIIALSVTPVVEKAQTRSTNQRGIDLFNRRLQALCGDLDITYVDIATPLKNEKGFLNSAFSNDKKLHLNETGLQIVTETLHRHAREELARQSPGKGQP